MKRDGKENKFRQSLVRIKKKAKTDEKHNSKDYHCSVRHASHS